MLSQKNKFQTIDEYIESFSIDIQQKLQLIRQTIHKAIPKAEEVISYQMPAFKLNKVLVYFAAFKNHIGFYPTSKAIKKFSKELSDYETSTGTIRFPFDKKLPLGLITKITKYRAKDSSHKMKKNSLKNK
jgi:uncharacterized protein YdhG (YjbR/CyaY superfamily)